MQSSYPTHVLIISCEICVSLAAPFGIWRLVA